MNFSVKNRGFSLLEISILLVVIGILTVSVVSGQSIIRNAKILSVVVDVNHFRSAVGTFEDYYDQLPGDMYNATRYWPTECVDVAGNTCNGNNDKSIDGAGVVGRREWLRVWQHLYLSGMVKREYSGIRQGLSNFTVNYNIPSGALHQSGFALCDLNTCSIAKIAYGRSGNNFIIAGSDGVNLNIGILSSFEAYSVDAKLDDGLADRGLIFALNGTGISKTNPNACVDGDTTDPNASYVFNNLDEKFSCRLYFWLKNE